LAFIIYQSKRFLGPCPMRIVKLAADCCQYSTRRKIGSLPKGKTVGIWAIVHYFKCQLSLPVKRVVLTWPVSKTRMMNFIVADSIFSVLWWWPFTN